EATRGTTEARIQHTRLAIAPVNARVEVNGAAAALVDGAVALDGTAGQTFDVHVVAEGIDEHRRVVVSNDGKCEPDRIELHAPTSDGSSASSPSAAAQAAIRRPGANGRRDAPASSATAGPPEPGAPAPADASARPNFRNNW